MIKKLVDTNIIIDRLASPGRYEDIFLSPGQILLSAIVLMELRAGSHSKEAVRAYHEIATFFKKVDRIITPSCRDYEVAGETLAKLQSVKGYELKKTASIANDCLIAASAKGTGSTVYTQNKSDFLAIRDVLSFKLVLV